MNVTESFALGCAVDARLRDLDHEIIQYKMDLSPIYVQLLFTHSNYANSYQDRLFFEKLYESYTELLSEAFHRMNRRKQIEDEVRLEKQRA